MKKLFFSLAVASMAIGCVNNPNGTEADTKVAAEAASTDGDAYLVDTAASSILWLGNKVSGKHDGKIRIQDGQLFLRENKLVAGSFTIDMASLENVDITDAEYRGKLEGHLKADDFFAVEKYPTSKFEITSVSEAENGKVKISGNLTIRDTTNNISFESTVTENSAERFVANADFNIDRKKWKIVYEGMKDDLISDQINFKINLVAKKNS